MTTFLAMVPPEAGGKIRTSSDVDRLVLVPDKFSYGAFAFSILWFLYHRLWMLFLGYLAVTLVLEIIAIQVGGAATVAVTFVISLFLGFEAQNLRRWSLERQGWKVVHHVVAANAEEAEARVLQHAALGMASPEPAVSTDPVAPAKPNPIIPRVGTEKVVGLSLGPDRRQ